MSVLLINPYLSKMNEVLPHIRAWHELPHLVILPTLLPMALSSPVSPVHPRPSPATLTISKVNYVSLSFSWKPAILFIKIFRSIYLFIRHPVPMR